MNLKEIARKYISAVNHYDVDSILNMVEENYIQHNPLVPTGRSAFIEFLSKLKLHGSRIENLRLFEDGHYIFMHHIWHNAAPFGSKSTLAFHIVRINQDGHVAEHWNVMTPLKEVELLSCKSFGGSRTTASPNLTIDTRNRTIRLGQELMERDVSEAAFKSFFHQDFVDHSSPVDPSGKDLFGQIYGANPKLKYLRQHKVFAEGEFALSISEGGAETDHVIIYDLFRYESGQIKERWSISQLIPKAQLANDNTMFGFN
jgi:predicted SnoaL-like aldol condensation-catalyzing enzyme